MRRPKFPLSFGCLNAANVSKGCLAVALFVAMIQVATAQQPAVKTTAPLTSLTNAASGAASHDSEPDDVYRIGPGDVLEIRVFNRPQLSRDAVRVDGHGVITMPLLEGDIQAACRTEKELAHVIATRYLEYQRNPHVDVFVKEYNSQPVAVLGAVNKAGQFQLQRRIRLLELLALAGGPRERAGTSIHVVHSEAAEICSSSKPGVSEDGAANGLVTYALRDTLRGNDKSNPYVRPGDIITLPEADQVYVIGNVASPKAIPLSGPLTVSQAIATAGGILPEARGKKVRIVRQAPDGKKEIYVDLKAIEKHGAEDVALQANDILDVPKPSGATKMLREIIRSTAPTLTLLPLQVLRF